MYFMNDRKRALLDRALNNSNGSFLELRRRVAEAEDRMKDKEALRKTGG